MFYFILRPIGFIFLICKRLANGMLYIQATFIINFTRNEGRGRICSSLHGYLNVAPVIHLTARFLDLKILIESVEFPHEHHIK